MSVVANVAINLDARGANQSLNQFQQRATAASRAAEQLQQGTTAAGQAAQIVGRTFEAAANGQKSYIDAAGRAQRENRQLVTSTDAVTAGLKNQARAGDEAGRSMSKLEGIMKQLGIAAGAAGVGRLAAGLTRTAATFEGELRKAAAIEGGGNFDQLRQDVERVASAAAGTPTQVAALATALSRAGFTAVETGQSLQGIVRGAEATAVTFEQMGSITSDVLRGFGIETAKTESVVDILVKTANSSNQSILDLGEAMSYAAPGAKTLGVDINDLSATIGLLANAGIRGSRAGTTLSTGLNRLQLAASGSQEALFEITRGSAMLTKAMNTLGSEVLDSQGKLKPLDEVLVAMKRNLDQLNVGQRVEITKALFGEEAGRGFQVLLSNSEEKIRAMFGTIRNGAGAAAATQKQMQGFSYSMEVLGGNVEIVSNAIGDKFIAVLGPMVNGLNAAISATQQLPKPLRDLASGAAAAGIAVLGVRLAMAALIPVIKGVIALLGPAALGGLIAAGPWIALAAGITAAAVALGSYRTEAQKLGAAAKGGGASDLAAARNRQAGLGQEISLLERQRQDATGRERAAIDRKLAVARRDYQGLAANIAAGERATATSPAAAAISTTVTPPAGGGGAAAAGAKKAAAAAKPPEDRTMELRDQLKLLIAVGEWEDRIRDLRFQGRERLALDAELSKELAQIENERVRSLQDANYEGERAHINAIAQAKQVAARRQSEDAIRELLSQRFQQELQNTQAVRDAAKPIEDLRKAQEQQLNDAKQYMRLVSEGMLPAEAQRIMNFEQTVKQQQESLDLQIAITEAAITEAEAKSLGSAELRKELTLLQRKRKAVDAAAAQGPGPGQTNAGRIEDALAAAQGELNELTAISTMAITSANAIGDAFGQAFKSIASGSASTKEVLADFFQSVSNAFLDMAAQIIAKQITMLILQTALKALGATGGVGAPGGEAFGVSPEGGGLWGGMSLGEMPALGTFAKGGVFTPDGPLHAFAKGGVVTAPTEFAFADGGTMRRGLMAEAEAEAIMPLKRTADGRLGVEATIPFQRSADDTTEPTIPFQRSADDSPSRSNPFAALSAASIPFTKSTERLMVERSDRETIAAINNPKPLEVRFESQVINGVEYVTAEQHRKGMAEAADRGRKLTLAELRNSVKTRKMMGLS